MLSTERALLKAKQSPSFVMRGLAPRIHVFGAVQGKTWMAGKSKGIQSAFVHRQMSANVNRWRNSDQPHLLERRMAAFGDDDVVVQDDAELFAGFRNFQRHVDVGLAGRRVARRVIVHHDHGAGV